MVEVLVGLAIAAVAGVIVGAIESLLEFWGDSHTMPEHMQAELSEHDEGMVLETKLVIEDSFGDSVVETLRNASNKERVRLMAEFAEELVKRYGLDIDVDITVSQIENCGQYNWQKRKAEFNIAALMLDGNHEHFEYCVRETLDTIIHELRHAVQHKAIRDEGFWNVEDERRMRWAENMLKGNYIRPEVNFRAYCGQPIEADAATFAARVMEGVR